MDAVDAVFGFGSDVNHTRRSDVNHTPPVVKLTATHDTPATLLLTASAEKAALSAGEAHTALAMISLKTSEHRLPMEIVAVVDRSGSMSGAKIATMKQTLSFLVSKGLQSGDSLAIVSFDGTVETRLPLSPMDSGGKSKAIEAINELQPGSTTSNLSGGLMQGIDLLHRATPPLPTTGGSTRAVLLFTDGIANAGIVDGPGIVTAVQGAMVAGSPMTIFTFGFGSDHNEDMLRSLAGTANGLYYYLADVEAIPLAFADCLGGLVAVVAQNVTLLLTPSPGVSVAHVHGSYTVLEGCTAQGELEAKGALEVSLGDVYAEEDKDLVLQLALPALPAPTEGACLHATLRYYSVPASRFVTTEARLSISRPAATPAEEPASPQSIKVEEQRLRVAAAEAITQAAQSADQGCLDEGRDTIWQCIMSSLASPVSACTNTAALLSDLESVKAGYESTEVYRSVGSKRSKMAAMSHAQQRSTHSTGSMYEGGSKRMAKMSLFTELFA